MYYPKSKILENQYTKGGELKDSSGKYYSGLYHVTYDGNYFTGATHTLDSQPLTLPPGNNGNVATPGDKVEGSSLIVPFTIQTSTYDTITNNKFGSLKNLILPDPHYPQPADSDYANGSFQRYFARKVQGTERDIFEVSADGFQDLSTNNLFKKISLGWKLTGPLYDIAGMPGKPVTYGVIDTNRRSVDAAEKTIPRLSRYLADYTQFAKISVSL